MQRAVRANEVAHPVDRNNDRILVGGFLFLVRGPLRFPMLDQIEVVRIQEVGSFAGRGKVRIVVEDHVGGLVFQGGETSLSQVAVRVTLLFLFAHFIERIEIVRHDDQVGLVGATVQGQPHGIHVALELHRVCNRGGRGSVSAGRLAEFVTPERPGCRVNRTDSALSVGLDEVPEAVDLFSQRAGRIEVDGELVGCGADRVFLPRRNQIDHGFFAAGVHPDFAARSGDVQRNLTIGVLDRGQHVRCVGVQRVIARIALVGAILGIFQRLGDFVTAADGLDLATGLHAGQQRVVFAHVVGNLLTPGAVSRRHHFRENTGGSSHPLVLSRCSVLVPDRGHLLFFTERTSLAGWPGSHIHGFSFQLRSRQLGVSYGC